MLALSFLLLIGMSLVAEGWDSAHSRRATSTSRWASRSSSKFSTSGFEPEGLPAILWSLRPTFVKETEAGVRGGAVPTGTGA